MSVTAMGLCAIPEDVADHAADAGVGPAEGFDSRWMIVGLGLERKGGALAKLDDAGVADEGRTHERRRDRVSVHEPQLLHQRLDERSVALGVAGLRRVDNRGPEGFVGAVFAPGLRQRLDLHVGRVTVERCKMALNDPKFLRVEVKRAFRIDRSETGVVEVADRNGPSDARCVVGVRVRRLNSSVRPTFDDWVDEQPGDDGAHAGLVKLIIELDSQASRCMVDVKTQCIGSPVHCNLLTYR